MSYLRASVRCTFAWGAAGSLHRDSPLEWAQFLAKKRKQIPGTESSSFLFFSSFDHMLESKEASELFVGLLHMIVRLISHLCSPLTIHLWFVFPGIIFLTDQNAQSDLTGSLLIRSDYRPSKSWQFTLCSCEAHAVFLNLLFINMLCFWTICWNKSNGHRGKCEIAIFSLQEVEMNIWLKEFKHTLKYHNQTTFTVVDLDDVCFLFVPLQGRNLCWLLMQKQRGCCPWGWGSRLNSCGVVWPLCEITIQSTVFPKETAESPTAAFRRTTRPTKTLVCSSLL